MRIPCKVPEIGRRNKDGYIVRHRQYEIFGEIFEHRIVYTKTYGPIPEGQEIRHTCNIRDCLEPTHLILGTHKDNIHDQIRSGTYNRQKLTLEQVEKIRQLYATGNFYLYDLAIKFKVGEVQIWRIVNGKRWINAY